MGSVLTKAKKKKCPHNGDKGCVICTDIYASAVVDDSLLI